MILSLFLMQRRLTVDEFNRLSLRLFRFRPTHPDVVRDLNQEFKLRGLGYLHNKDLIHLCNQLERKRRNHWYNSGTIT